MESAYSGTILQTQGIIKMLNLIVHIILFNFLGYTLFEKIFDNPSSYNMYITYSFLGVQILVNVLSLVLLIACISNRKKIL